MSVETAALHATVRGRVQGVGFRLFAERRARDLDLKGWVRNLADGVTVEVVAEGRRADLEAFVEQLKQGPRLAEVEAVDVSWIEAGGQFLSFQTRP
jgi:acylphosphatase